MGDALWLPEADYSCCMGAQVEQAPRPMLLLQAAAVGHIGSVTWDQQTGSAMLPCAAYSKRAHGP